MFHVGAELRADALLPSVLLGGLLVPQLSGHVVPGVSTAEGVGDGGVRRGEWDAQ